MEDLLTILKKGIKDAKLYTGYECMAVLDWTPTNYDTCEGTGPVECSCGGSVLFGGCIGTEHAHCPLCEKGMQDMTGILPVSNTSAIILNIDENDPYLKSGRVWMPKRFW
jgi:hypothetical protein